MNITPMFSSNGFVVVTSVFVSLTHFQLTFKCDMHKGSNFTILHADIQLSQWHLLKNYSFLLSMSWHSLENQSTINIMVYSVLPILFHQSICVSHSNSTVLDSCNIWINFKIGQCDFSRFPHLFSDLFWVPWKSIWVLDLIVNSYQKSAGILIGIA